MSRSNPNADRNPNPAERFFEWKGKAGTLQYWDKEKEEKVTVKLPFTCIVLDQLSTIKGYNKRLKTGIYANEVRDLRSARLVVKFFKGDKIAEGFYAEIKDRVTSKSVGGTFVSSVYIAYRDGDKFKLGNLQLSGCALTPWFEFVKQNRKAINERAVIIAQDGINDQGEIHFYPPIFGLKDVSPETNAIASEMDVELQEYLKAYFGRTVTDQVAAHGEDAQPNAPDEDAQADAAEDGPPEADDVPF